MWQSKVILELGEVLVPKGSKTVGFMGETDVNDYSIVGADGVETGTVTVEDRTAVKGFKRTITVVQTARDGSEVMRTRFNPK